MSRLARGASWIRRHLGGESPVVRLLRPGYEALLGAVSARDGLAWPINGVPYRVVPSARRQMGSSYDASLAAWMSPRIRAGQSMLDVGANVGVYVLQFAHWSRPDGRVVAVEPNPATRALLERHIDLNGLRSRVQVVDAAVAAEPGTAEFFASGSDGMSRLGAPNPSLQDMVDRFEVRVTTIDDVCASMAFTPDWLFIDVEGFEIQALAGARTLLASRRGLSVVVEMHPDSWSIAGTTRADAEALLAELRLRAEPLSGQADPLGGYGHVWLRPD